MPIDRRQVLAMLAAGPAAGLAAAQDTPPGVLRAAPHAIRLAGSEAQDSPVLAFNAQIPGPLLRARRGEPFAIRLENGTPTPITVHWQGVRLENAMDGVPDLTQAPVAPGAAFDCRFTPPDAGTFLYRAWGAGGDLGLSGLLVVEAPGGPDVDREQVLVIDDWPAEGSAGPIFSVNGAALPMNIVARPHERLRLRIANAASRIVALAVGAPRVTLLAFDGQPAEPMMLDGGRLMLAPGNRADIVVDMPGADAELPLLMAHETGEARLGTIAVAGVPVRPAPAGAVEPLPANPLPSRIDLATALRIELPIEDGRMAGRADGGPGGPPLFRVRRGRAVVLAIANRTPRLQSIHVHGHAMRWLDDLDDSWKPWWVDTVVALPMRTTRVAFVADNPGRWLMDGRAPGLLAWFEVG